MKLTIDLSVAQIDSAKEILQVLHKGLVDNRQFTLTDYGKSQKDRYIEALQTLLSQLHC